MIKNVELKPSRLTIGNPAKKVSPMLYRAILFIMLIGLGSVLPGYAGGQGALNGKPNSVIPPKHNTPTPTITSTPSFSHSQMQVLPWAVGQEVEYRITYYLNGKIGNVQDEIYRIVGQSVSEGNQYFNIEKREIFGSGDQAVTQIEEKNTSPLGLVDFKELLFGRFQYRINRWLIQNNNEFPSEIELPKDSKVFYTEPDPVYQAIPNQQVTVSAGVFQAIKLTTVLSENICGKTDYLEKENYNSSNVPIWGAVRWITKFKSCPTCKMPDEQDEMDLVRYQLSGAGPSIVQTPVFMSLKQQEAFKIKVNCDKRRWP